MVQCTLHKLLWLDRNLVIQTQTSELLNGVFVFYSYIDFTADSDDWLIDVAEGWGYTWRGLDVYKMFRWSSWSTGTNLKKQKDYFFSLNFCIKTNLWQYLKPTTHILDGLSKLRLQFLLILDNV